MAEAEFRLGALGRAIERGGEAVAGLRAGGHRAHLSYAQTNLAGYCLLDGDQLAARHALEEALPIVAEEGGYWTRICLQSCALLGTLEGRAAAAAQLIGYVDAAFAVSGEPRQPAERQIRERAAEILSSALPSDDLDIYSRDGARWSEQQAVQFCRDHLIYPSISVASVAA
jgi:hypothetical protein